MQKKKIHKLDVLGVEYTLEEQTVDQQPIKLADKEGYVELYSKEIVLRTGYEDVDGTVNNVNAFKRSLLRHELFHAVFHECGLSQYCNDETLIDFLAIQFPKISTIMEQVDNIYE